MIVVFILTVKLQLLLFPVMNTAECTCHLKLNKFVFVTVDDTVVIILF